MAPTFRAAASVIGSSPLAPQPLRALVVRRHQVAALTPPPVNEGIAGYVQPQRRYAIACSNDRA